MARGRFGRRRGGSSSLATLVASLLREQRQAEDRAMFDAWQNGGQFKGKPVTDERLLSYIRSRRDGFAREDPLWDQWNNTLIQHDFAIGEQKIGLAFRQGKASAGAVAAFYREKLKSIPKNSAFYRDVAGRAAQWAGSVSRAARGRARGRATSGLRDKLNQQLYDQENYLALEAALTEYAKQEGLISGSETLTDADATELRDMFERGLYAGEEQITFDVFRNAAQRHYKALGSEINTRRALGQQAIEASNKRKRFLNGTLLRLNAVDERVQYELAREAWLDDVQKAQGNPWAIQQANSEYLKNLESVHGNALAAQDEMNANDPEFIGGLVNESAAIATGESRGKTVADLYDMNDDAGSGEDQAAATTQLLADIKDLESNKAYFGQAEPGSPLEVVRWPTGGPSALGLDDSLQPSITTVNGEKRTIYLKGEPVTASVVLDEAGDPVDLATTDPATMGANIRNGLWEVQSSGVPAGYVFTNPTNGNVKYGVRDAQGNLVFTDTNPWSDDPTNLGAGLTILTPAENRGTESDPRYFAAPAAALKRPVGIDQGFDPMLADSTVSLKDMLALSEQGIKGFGDDELTAYQTRLMRQQEAQTALASQRAGERDPNAPVGSLASISDPRDYRSPIADQLSQTRQTLRSAFARDIDRPDYVPPTPKLAPIPKLAAPTPTSPTSSGSGNISIPRPDIKWEGQNGGSDGSESGGDVDIPDRPTGPSSPNYPPPKPKIKPKPRPKREGPGPGGYEIR